MSVAVNGRCLAAVFVLPVRALVPVGSAVVPTHIVVAHTTEKEWHYYDDRPLRTVALTAVPKVQLCLDVPTSRSLGGLLLGLVGRWHMVVRDRHNRTGTRQEEDARRLKGVTSLLPHASSRVTWFGCSCFCRGTSSERGITSHEVQRQPF